MQTEEAAIKIAELLQRKSEFQESVGELVLSVKETYGTYQTNILSELIKEQGVTLSPHSLRQYAWITRDSKELKLPMDLDFSLRRSIIRSPKIKKYLKMVKEGYNSAQIKREMALDNKQSKTSHTGYCKDCNAEVDVKKHDCKKEKKV